MGQGSSKERYKSAVKKLSSIELANIEAVFNEVSTKREDGSRHVELSLINRQDFAERFRLPGFIAERLFLAFDRTEVLYLRWCVCESRMPIFEPRKMYRTSVMSSSTYADKGGDR